MNQSAMSNQSIIDSSVGHIIGFLNSDNMNKIKHTRSYENLMKYNPIVPIFGAFTDYYDQYGNTGVFTDAGPASTGVLANISIMSKLNSRKSINPFHAERNNSPLDRNYKYLLNNVKCVSDRKVLYTCSLTDGDKAFMTPVTTEIDYVSNDDIRVNARNQNMLYMNDWIRTVVRLSFGLFFTTFHNWNVNFSVPGSCVVKVMVDPHEALELFKSREKAIGKTRRDALIHWVQKHLRRNKTNQDMHEVRKHIRGKQQFCWNGYNCLIEPSIDYINSINAECESKKVFVHT